MAFSRITCITVQILILISISLTKAGLTQIELREKFGQVGTFFNDGKSCHRTCDGQNTTCYFEFHAQLYDTLNSLCGGCENGTLSDCFNTGCIPGSGVERGIMTINQQLPGPSINVCKGDRIIVDVSNHMPGQGLTIHWHGIHQKKTPWMDGIAMVTQCPISSANTFRYAFYATQKGTQFWHAHTGLHRSNGIVGSLIVREPNDLNANMYDYDLAEHTIMLFDFDNHVAEDKEPGIVSVVTLPNSLLINGFGSYSDSTTGKNKFAPMAVFYVQRGKRHRFRFIDVGSHVCQFGITISGHNLTVIATDGYPIEPIVVDSLACSPGERYDIVMHATSDPNIAEALLTVRGLAACSFSEMQVFARIIFVDNIYNHQKKIEHHAPLKKRPSYDSVSVAAPNVTLNYPLTNCLIPGSYCIAAAKQKKLPCAVHNNLRNVKPYKEIPLHFKMVPIYRRPFVYMNILNVPKVATINRIANALAPVPGLVQDDSFVNYCNAHKLPDRYDIAKDNQSVYHCPHLIELELNKIYELKFIDDTDTPDEDVVSHPIHLHGYAFEVIDMGTRDQLISGKTAFTNAAHPPVIKDTVTLPQHGFVTVRLRTVNPGYWMLHCHIEHHMPIGMMLVLKVGTKNDISPPPSQFPMCGNYLMHIDA